MGCMVLGAGFEPAKALGRQIYSLLRLTASLSQHGAACRIRTDDPRFTKPLL